MSRYKIWVLENGLSMVKLAGPTEEHVELQYMANSSIQDQPSKYTNIHYHKSNREENLDDPHAEIYTNTRTAIEKVTGFLNSIP